jgi:hypothetical protein
MLHGPEFQIHDPVFQILRPAEAEQQSLIVGSDEALSGALGTRVSNESGVEKLGLIIAEIRHQFRADYDGIEIDEPACDGEVLG